MDRAKRTDTNEPATPEQPSRDSDDAAERDEDRPNPPHTTKGGITSPKFGSAGSGGAEIEPGLKRD